MLDNKIMKKKLISKKLNCLEVSFLIKKLVNKMKEKNIKKIRKKY